MWGYWKAHNLEPGTNLIRHHFKSIGLPDWVPESQEVVSPFPCLHLSQPSKANNLMLQTIYVVTQVDSQGCVLIAVVPCQT